METYAVLVRTAGRQTTAVCGATLDVGEIGPWLVYLTDPAASADPAGWRTDILVPFLAARFPLRTERVTLAP